MYEKSYLDNSETFMNDLDENFITQYWNNNYEKSYDFETMKYMLNPWDYIDDKKFVENWIDDEVDNEDIDDIINDDYDKEHYLIPYLVNNDFKYKDDSIIQSYFDQESLDEDNEERIKEIKVRTEEEGDAEWILQELDCEHLRDLVRELGDENDLLRNYFEERYRNYSARDIMEEFYNKSELDNPEWWDKGYYNIMWYVNEKEMVEDMPDPELEEMIAEIEIDNNDDFQKLVFEHYPEKCVDMIYYSVVGSKLAELEEFQMAYFEKVLEDGLEEDENFEITMDNVKEITDLGVEIHQDVIDKFNIEHLVNARDMGLL